MEFLRELGAWFASFADPWFLKSTITDFLKGILDYFVQLFPYVVLGSLLGELLTFTSWTAIIYRFTKGKRVLPVISATVLGILSPLCTYGTVPVLIALFHGGIPAAPLISFLAASSMMNPQLFIMTVGGLGMEMALLRLLCVFLFASLCGFLTLPLPENFVVRPEVMAERGDGSDIENRPHKKFTIGIYIAAVAKNLLFVGRMMLIGISIAAFVDLLPMRLLFGELDTTTPLGILAAAAAGIPVYACGGGTIPMVASLMSQGLSRGSALAFLTVGPATRITSLAAIGSIIRVRFIVCYVAVLLAFSVCAGMLLA